MKDRAFTALLKQAARHAIKGSEIQARLTDAFEQRYGTTYSAVDCDRLIDELDYGLGHPATIDAKIADREMADCGHPRLPTPSNRED